MYMVSIPDLDKKVCMVVGVMFDIRDEKGLLDSLTGTYNHLAFENKCTSLIRQKGTKLLFVMLDVDDFKIVNDTLGHNVGDRVLSQTGQVLKEAVGANGIVGRLGGDEFALMMIGDETRAIELMETVQKEIAMYNAQGKNKFAIDMSVGCQIVLCTEELSIPMVLEKADKIMYEEKKKKGKAR